jgi:broad specificity phosphatase PhoE
MLFIIRHGESEANAAGIAQGSGLKSDLTELGKLQAKQTGELLKTLKFDRFYSSTVSRAIETADIIASEIKFNINGIKRDPLLNEADAGSVTGTTATQRTEMEKKIFSKEFLDEKASLEKLMKSPFDMAANFVRFTKSFEQYKKGFGAETQQEEYTRVDKFFSSLNHKPNENILIVSHNGFINSILSRICGLEVTVSEFLKPGQKNCHISIITHDRKILLLRCNQHLK